MIRVGPITGSVDLGGYGVGYPYPSRRAELTPAIALFGPPASVETFRYAYERYFAGCLARWPALGLELYGQNTALTTVLTRSRAPRPCDEANFEGRSMVVRGAAAQAPWRTTKGLRVGDRESRIRELHPAARLCQPTAAALASSESEQLGGGRLCAAFARHRTYALRWIVRAARQRDGSLRRLPCSRRLDGTRSPLRCFRQSTTSLVATIRDGLVSAMAVAFTPPPNIA